MTGWTGAAVMLGYAALLGLVAPLLRRARWVVRAPTIAIRLWQALSVAWVASLTLAGLALATPWLLDSGGSAAPGREAVAGTTLAAAVLARAGYVLARELTRARRTRRRHAHELARGSRTLAGLAATIVDHDAPQVYCLPGPARRPRIVVTSGALTLLDDSQLDAVLAHERAHLRARHHLVTVIAGALQMAFPGVPLLRDARREIAILAEMAADDAACRNHDAAVLASALVELARERIGVPALGAGGHTVLDRVQRMLAPTAPLTLRGRIAAGATSAGALALPVACSCAPVTVLVAFLSTQLPS